MTIDFGECYVLPTLLTNRHTNIIGNLNVCLVILQCLGDELAVEVFRLPLLIFLQHRDDNLFFCFSQESGSLGVLQFKEFDPALLLYKGPETYIVHEEI